MAESGLLRYTAADLLYDPASHTTRLPDGRDVPHVTHVLSVTGMSTDFEALVSRGGRLAGQIDLARDRGTAVHADCHAYDDNDLVWRTMDVRVAPFVTSWAQCREDMGLVPVTHGRERQIFHPLFVYTGFLDGIFRRGDRVILIDIKTGDPASAACDLQTAAYEAAWLSDEGALAIDERWAVWLLPGRRVPYRIINYSALPDAWRDFQLYTACLTVYREQVRRRRG